MEKVTNGVPQGLILVPLHFLICINDLPKITNNDAKVVMFADDTSIIVTISNQGRLPTALKKNCLVESQFPIIQL
jgi:hypothetical protein